MPPVAFKELVEAVVDDAEIKVQIDRLLQLKKSGNECDLQMVDAKLQLYTHRLADYYDAFIGSFRPELHRVSSNKLDAILYDMVFPTKPHE